MNYYFCNIVLHGNVYVHGTSLQRTQPVDNRSSYFFISERRMRVGTPYDGGQWRELKFLDEKRFFYFKKKFTISHTHTHVR